MKLAMIVSSGISSTQAMKRGAASRWTGLAPRHARASICSVMRMVASSAAIAPPTRPASIVAASTGPSSRTTDMLMIEPRRVAMPIAWNWA